MEKLTLQDIRMGLGPDGKSVAKVIDVMSTSGHLTEDGLWLPTNSFGKNVTPRVAAEPQGEFRRQNRGVAPAKGGLEQIEDYVGYIETMSMVDDKVIRTVGENMKQQVRLQHDSLFAGGLAKQSRNYTINGDKSADPDAFNGWKVRRNALGTEYVIDCADGALTGTKRTSMYLVRWNTEVGCSYLYPQETKVGLQMEDFGRQVIQDPVNTDKVRFLPMWITWFYFDLGFAVKDDKALIRLANIDVERTADVAYMQLIMDKINLAMRVTNFSGNAGELKAYGNLDMLGFMDNMRHRLTNFQLTEMNVEGKYFADSYRGMPIRRCDEITSAELAVS